MYRKVFLRCLAVLLLVAMLCPLWIPEASAATPSSTANANATLAYTLKGLPIGRAVQNFYIGETYLYITQRADNVTYLSRLRIEGDEAHYMDQMVLNNWGHGEALDFYRYNGKEYFMVTTNGSDEYPKYYWSLQIARLEYEAGKTYSSYTGVKRFTNMKRATSDGTSLGGAYRVAACVNGNYTVFRIQVTATHFVYSIYDTNKLNKLLDSSSPDLPSGDSTNYCLSMEDATSAFQYMISQEGSDRILPNGNFQGIELSSLDSIYLAGGGEGDTPQIARMTYKGAYAKLINITNVGTHEIEGLQTDRGRLYFLIVTSTNSEAKKNTQKIYYVNESVFGINHSLVNISDAKPTCTAEGLSDGATCSKCGQSQDVQERMAVLPHSYGKAEASPVKDEDILYFGFDNAPEDKERYSKNPVYGGVNYDAAGALRTRNFYNGSANLDFPAGDTQSLGQGVAKTKLTGPYPTQSSYAKSVSRRFIFGESNDTDASVGSLKYIPTNAEVFQVRFKLENLKLRSDITATDKARSLALRYYKNSDTTAVLHSNKYGGSYVTGDYMTVTLPLDSAFTSAEVITKIVVEFHGFVKDDDSKDAYLTLDYVYVGPKATAPTQENGYLYFDFDDSPAARYRYAGSTYGATNFDRLENWSYDSANARGVRVADGRLSLSPVNESCYVHTGGTNQKPLRFTPGQNDYCQVSIQIADALSTSGNNKGTFTLHFGVGNSAIANGNCETVDFDLTGRTHTFILTFPMKHANYRSAAQINALRMQFSNMKSADGKLAKFSVDYLYIGPKEGLPAPLTCKETGATTYSCTHCGKNTVTLEVLPSAEHTAVVDEAVAATCTMDGKTEGSHCSVCNAVIKAQETVPATGHDYKYTDNGNGTHTGTCARCEDLFTENHKFEGETCFCGGKVLTVDESIKIYHTLDLASDISITFAVPQTALASYDSYYLEVVLPEYEGNTQTGTSTVQIQPVVNGKYYYFTLTGITAVRMGDMVDATLHMTRGTAQYISAVDTYSVATYAYGMLSSTTDAKMLTLCADLLRYGAEAQSFKGYRTDSLVDANLTEAQRAYLSNTENLTFTAMDSYLGDLASPVLSWVGKTLDLGSKVGMKFVFNAKNYSGNIENLSMKVTYMGSNSEPKTVTLTGAEVYSAANKYYSFTFYGLLASELRTVVDVAVYEGETQLTETLRYSAESYASKNTTGALGNLCKALFAYSDSAKTYFTK